MKPAQQTKPEASQVFIFQYHAYPSSENTRMKVSWSLFNSSVPFSASTSW